MRQPTTEDHSTARPHLFHDPRFPLGKGNVATGLVLDELDVDLPPLPTGLIVIVVIVVAGSTEARALDAAILLRTVPIAGRQAIVLDGGRLGGIDDVGHLATGRIPSDVWSRKSRR